MTLIQKILLPIDTSAVCAEQLQYATMLSKAFGCELLLLTIIDNADDIPNTQTLESVATELSSVRERLSSLGAKVTILDCVEGSVIEQVVSHAQDNGVDMIVLGSHPKVDGARHRLGHIAEQIIRKAQVPVMVAKIDQEPRLEKILCPVDFSDTSMLSLRNAIIVARQFDAHLYILSAFESARNISLRYTVDVAEENNLRHNDTKQKMENFLKHLDLSTVQHSIHIEAGNAEAVINNFIAKEQIDILFIGSSGRTGLSKFLLGSTTEKVVRRLPVSFVASKSEMIIKEKVLDRINTLELHYNTGLRLKENNNLREAITQFEHCLAIDDMHIPSIYKLAHIYESKQDKPRTDFYLQQAQEIIARVWDANLVAPMKLHLFK